MTDCVELDVKPCYTKTRKKTNIITMHVRHTGGSVYRRPRHFNGITNRIAAP